MTSYHDRIQDFARAVEAERAKQYSEQGKDGRKEPIHFTEVQLCFLYGSLYKMLRVKCETTNKLKALDDIQDSYNYDALLFNNMVKEIEAENPGKTVQYDIANSKFVLVDKP